MSINNSVHVSRTFSTTCWLWSTIFPVRVPSLFLFQISRNATGEASDPLRGRSSADSRTPELPAPADTAATRCGDSLVAARVRNRAFATKHSLIRGQGGNVSRGRWGIPRLRLNDRQSGVRGRTPTREKEANAVYRVQL